MCPWAISGRDEEIVHGHSGEDENTHSKAERMKIPKQQCEEDGSKTLSLRSYMCAKQMLGELEIVNSSFN